MIDIKLIRENSKLVKENIKKKFQTDKLVLVDTVKKLDDEWRKLKYQIDKLRASRNKVSEQINKAKKAKENIKPIIEKAKQIPDKIKKIEEKASKLQEQIKEIMYKIPNIIHKSVPSGKNDTQNKEIKKIGKPNKFSFKVKSHVELGENLGILDFDTSAKTSGNGFYYMKGELAILNMALINFARDFMIKQNFEYVEPPLLIREEILNGVYSNTEIEQMAYKVDGEDLYLIATSEHPLIGQFIDTTLQKNKLPITQTAYSMCFRKEIGSHGIDEKGLFRTHQFNKVEMVVICKPEESDKYFEKMKKISVDILKGLGLPIRVLKICSGDLGDLKKEQVDIEVYSPRKKDYIETGSCSNLTDCQARKLGITTRIKGERVVPHTLNNTALATPRPLVAILENNQQKDGSVKIPRVLVPYMGGKTVIGKKNK